MNYVDGFVAAVPTENRKKYQEHAELFAKEAKKYGVISIVECWGEDVPVGEVTSFPMAVQCKPDETVIFSWIVWPSREVRDAGWEMIMADPQLQPEVNPMPFDGKRMIYGGFQVILEA